MGKQMILIGLSIFDIVFAFVTSVVQTDRINKKSSKYNKTNLITILILAVFAAGVSVYQSNVIIQKTSNKATKNIRGNQKRVD